MKKTYKKIRMFAALFLIVAMQVGAQPLSGLYTINSGAATAGTNFQTFTALATALNTNGVSGPVTVNVITLSGPYVEQPAFNAITGTSGTNKIVINGNGNLLVFNSTSSGAPHTLLLNGADFMTFNNLNVEGQGTTYAMVVVLTNGADRNTFNNCVFTAPLNGTSSIQCPWQLTSSPTSPTSGGTNSGNFNTVNSCTMANGYYGIVMYGLTGSPYQTNNSILNCRITDFYVYGMYYPYQNFITVRNNTIDRLTRTTSTTCYGILGYWLNGALVEGNVVWKLFNTPALQGNPNACYGFYTYYTNTPGGVRGQYRNNILTDIKNNGTIYGWYNYYSNSDYYNNTIDLDWAGSTSAGTIWGMYCYGAASYNNSVTNNIITCRRGGSGSNRYGLYIALTGNIFVDRNDIIMVAGSGVNNIGYYGTPYATLPAWNTALGAGTDISIDPMYVSATDLHPTNVLMDNYASPLGLVFDQMGAVRSSSAPDIGALEFLSPGCSGAMPSNSIAGPTWSLCPGEDAGMIIGALSPSLGITYQWQYSSISNVGPFA
ncbi:MAG: hypothetical protein PSX36_06630, partial [bacterium]|nr:hypothetical protein [bacterium]